MKILYLTYDGLSDPLGQSQILPYLAGLSDKGVDITIVSFEKKNTPENLYSSIRKELDTHKIKWIFLNYTKYPPVLSTLYDIYRLRKISYRLTKQNHFRLVHCRSYITSLVGLQLKNQYGIKFVFDMRGFYADERVESGLWNQQHIIYRMVYRYFKKKEKIFLSAADKIVVLTNAAKDVISKSFFIPVSKIQVIPCCVDTNQFNPENISIGLQTTRKKELSISDADFVVSYLGTIGTWYLLDEMLDFFNRLLITFPNSKFLFITQHPSDEIFKSVLKKNIAKEKIIIIKAQRNEVPVFLSLSHLSIYFIMPTFSKLASSPTKQAEILSMGIPVISNSGIGDSVDLMNHSKAGWLIDNFTNDEFDRAIKNIPLLLKINKDEIRNFAISRLSLSGGIDHYLNIYNEIQKAG